MDSATPLDYALFQLSPRRSRCELIVTGNGRTEKIASGFLKPFVTQLKVAEEQAAQSAQLIKLKVERTGANGGTWFSKGTLERFVRFVSTPEVLELVSTFDAEMSQLEGARKIYSQGAGHPLSATNGGSEAAATTTPDATKNELLRAIDVRLAAVKQDLATACCRASSAGFTMDNVSELLLFADHFGAHRLNEACTKFISLCQRRPDLISHQSLRPLFSSQWKGFDDGNIRSSSGSDMSIDEPEIEPSGSSKPLNGSSQHPVEGTGESLSEQQQKPLMQSSSEKQVEKAMEPFPPAAPPADLPQQTGGGGSRRLSVQDRINLFESKQKEQAAGSSNSSPSVASRTITGRGEHRRAPSMEKSVLRRWSSSSDMSIDFNGNDSSGYSDKKDSSFAGARTSANTEDQSTGKAEEEVTSRQLLSQKDGPNNTSSTTISSHSSSTTINASTTSSGSQAGEGNNLFGSSEHLGQSAQATSGTQSKEFQKPGKDHLLKDHKAVITSLSDDHTGVKNQEILRVSSPSISLVGDSTGQKDHESSCIQPKGISSAMECIGVKDQRSRTLARKTEIVVGKSNVFPDSRAHLRASGPAEVVSSGIESRAAGSQGKNLSRKANEVGGKGTPTTGLPSRFIPVKTNEYNPASQVQALHRTPGADHRTPGADHTWNSQGDKAEIYTEGNVSPVFAGKKADERAKIADPPTKASLEQVQVIRLSRGKQELNDELQMKAKELEKLFAVHKLRIQNDQMISSRRSKATDIRPAHISPDQLPANKQVKESTIKGVEVLNMVENQEYNISVQQKPDIQNLSEELRGKFYEKYVQKRESKLREEWRMKRAQKEASMKALHDSLERSQAEMRDKLSRSADARDLARHTRTSFGVRSGLRNRGQGVAYSLAEQELPEQVYPDQDKSYGDNLSGYGSSKSTDSKKFFSTRISSASVPKPSVKATNPSSRNRRTLPQNPAAQSVPDWSNFRKENTKPSTWFDKANARAQQNRFSRSKSISQETNSLLKEDTPRRSQSMRKSSAGPGGIKGISTLDDDIMDLTEARFSKHLTEGAFNYKVHKNGETTMLSDVFQNGEEPEELVDQQDDLHGMIKVDEHERMSIEDNPTDIDFQADSDSEKGRLSQESADSDDPGSENVAAVDSKFDSFSGSVQDSSRQSPVPWNSHLPQLFSYAHEASDYDVFVGSPTSASSPASWNSNPLNQMMEADAARMRKKWGTAQVPMIGANPSQQSRKDVTKGFKRLLKFGRKSRNVDSLLNDWVSASTTSEGDDDTEDGHDLAAGSADDLRKTRMGYSYDVLNNSEIFTEQAQSLRSSIPNPPVNFQLREDHLTGSSLRAPRSFFSLSTFRSKGSESKLR